MKQDVICEIKDVCGLIGDFVNLEDLGVFLSINDFTPAKKCHFGVLVNFIRFLTSL